MSILDSNDSMETQGPRRGFQGGLVLGLVAGLLASGVGGWLLRPRPTAAPVAGKQAYQCPMHPQILQDHPGSCPICGMDLVVMEGGVGPQSPGPEGLVSVQISPERQQLMGLRTVEVVEGEGGGSLRSPGRVAVDERRVHKVALRVDGYVEKLQADFLGRPVRKGEVLMELHSPEFVAAQRELLAASGALKAHGAGDQGQRYRDLVETARRRLAFLGAGEAFIAELERSGQVQHTLGVLSPADGVLTAKTINTGSKVAAMDQPLEITDLGGVWVLADLYEGDLERVKVGMAADFEVPALGNRRFAGRVAFLDPALDPKTRTLKARIELPNPGLQLRPEMLGEVLLKAPGRRSLRVPLDAVLDSGTLKVAFVEVGNGYFEPRELKVGLSSGETVEVLEGLTKGERVVTRANFLVDSESRLKAALNQMAQKSGAAPAAPASGHAH